VTENLKMMAISFFEKLLMLTNTTYAYSFENNNLLFAKKIIICLPYSHTLFKLSECATRTEESQGKWNEAFWP
jgi:hypothetical protein